MNRPTVEVADIFRARGQDFIDRHCLDIAQLKAIRAITQCRTAALGGHIDVCPQCGGDPSISYNSCRNRHCNKCQSQARNPRHLGAEIGFFSILHTWGQNLLFHPHIHCVIPGGGIAPDKTRWIHPEYPFFLPVKILSKVFRGKFVYRLRRLHRKKRLTCAGFIRHLAEPKLFSAFIRTLFRQNWVVYAKPAFGGPNQVIRYLGRYTHRVAISNHRLVSFDGEQVTFRWRDYANGNKQRLMTVSAEEFMRRFLLHVLPKKFVRIRHFGIMANFRRSEFIDLCRRVLAMTPLVRSVVEGASPLSWLCPRCRTPMILTERITASQLFWRLSAKRFDDSS